MAGLNKTPLIGWHSADPTLKPWVEAEAKRRGMTLRELLDEALSAYRRQATLCPQRGERESWKGEGGSQ
jgi:hypothetical protein